MQQNNAAVMLGLDQETKLSDGHLPYSFSILGKKEFPITNYEWDYPAIGIRIILKRKTLGTLIGGFYIPTALFAILSMISFFINPDVVSTVYLRVFPLIDNGKKCFLDSWQNGSTSNIVFDILKCLQFIESSPEKRI